MPSPGSLLLALLTMSKRSIYGCIATLRSATESLLDSRSSVVRRDSPQMSVKSSSSSHWEPTGRKHLVRVHDHMSA